jgi:hypothetical protein
MRFRRKVSALTCRVGLALVALLSVLGSPVAAVAQGQLMSVTNLTINPNPATVGETIVFTAKVLATTGSLGIVPTGTVTFYSGSTQLGTATLDSNGVGTYSTSSLAIGVYFTKAVYSGDHMYEGSTSPLVLLTVYQGGANTPTSTSLTIQPDPAMMGQTVTFSARVSGGTGALGQVSGTVTFYNATTQMALATVAVDTSGLATYGSSSFDVGTYSIIAAYSGDSKYQPSGSPAVPLKINPQGVLTPTTTTVTSSNPNSDFGSTVIFFASVSGGIGGSYPTGTITFLDGATTLGTGTLSNGSASYSTSTLSIGTHSITAQYSGDADFEASTSNAFTQTVSFSSGSSTFVVNVNPSALTLTAGSSGTTVVTVTPAGGFNQQISFTCSGLPIYATCSFSPAKVSPDGSNTPLTSTLTINTNVGSSWLRPGNLPFGRSLPTELATLLSPVLFGVCGIGAARRSNRRGKRGVTRAALFMAGLCVLISLWFVSCGGSGTKRLTPTGNSTVTVVGSSSSQGQSTTFSLTVQ